MDKEGANRRRITFEGKYNDSAAWSPRADRIAYVSRVDKQFTIFTVSPDGSDLQRVTIGHDRDNEDPSWAPDGRHLVVSSNRSGHTNLWVLDVETGEARQLTQGKGKDTGPCWSGPPQTARAKAREAN
jgi:TolB protein